MKFSENGQHQYVSSKTVFLRSGGGFILPIYTHSYLSSHITLTQTATHMQTISYIKLSHLSRILSHIYIPRLLHTQVSSYTHHISHPFQHTPSHTQPVSHTPVLTHRPSHNTPLFHTHKHLSLSHTQHTHRPSDTQTSISYTHHTTQTHVYTYLFFSLKETK